MKKEKLDSVSYELVKVGLLLLIRLSYNNILSSATLLGTPV